MKKHLLLCCACLLMTAPIARAESIIVGNPGNSQLMTPTGPSPKLTNTPINFDSLTPFVTSNSFTFNGGVTVSSPDGLEALPFSTQSFPIELFDTSTDGSANIFIRLAQGVLALGVGIADSDPVSVTFQALNAAGTPFGTIFTEDLASTESQVNTGNGYYVLTDTTPDIFGLQIRQTAGNVNFSGLAIDDVQPVPEPATVVLWLTGLVLMAVTLRKRLA